MTTFVLVLGLLLAILGTTITNVLVAESRRVITRAAVRRLRVGAELPRWLGQVGGYLTAAGAATSLGAVLLGSDLPALLSSFGLTAFVVLVLVVGVPAILLVAYLVPRWLTRVGAVRSAGIVLPLIRPWAALLRPVLPAAAEADPDTLIRQAASGGLGADPELVMAGGIMTFSERPVRDVMTPRIEVVAAHEGATRAELAQLFVQSGFSRLPVFRGTLDEVVGMVHAFDLLTVAEDAPLPVRPVTATPASRHCGDLLLEMQRERRHLAVVLDEFGGTLGIATLEDLLETLVGEIFDEHDPPVAPAGPATPPGPLETDATTPIAEVTERFGVTLPETAATTVSGMLAELAGRIPTAGERFVLRGLEFDVLQASPARAERVVVRAAGRTTQLEREPR